MKQWALWLVILLTLAGCVLNDASEEENGQLIYYVAEGDYARGGDAIQACRVPLDLPEGATLQETAAAVVEQLLREPADIGLSSPLPDTVELLSLEIRNQQAVVDLSGDVQQLDGVELTLADYCLTLSLTALEGIDAVLVTAERRMIGQQPKQVFAERDVLLSTMDNVLQTVDVTLYFVNSAGALTGERHTLELYEGQTVVENLVAELLAGPLDRELTTVIPEGFRVTRVYVENGVCYVNLPASSLELLPADQALQWQILWSLADSLYSVETVTQLRFLTDGMEMTTFGEIPLDMVASPPKG